MDVQAYAALYFGTSETRNFLSDGSCCSGDVTEPFGSAALGPAPFCNDCGNFVFLAAGPCKPTTGMAWIKPRDRLK